MAKLIDLKPSERRTIVVYGDSGAGKTCWTMGFPGPIWVADFDGKVSSGAAFVGAFQKEKLSEIEYENFKGTATQNGYDRFRPFLSRLEERAKPEEVFPFKTIVVDSLTTLSHEMMLSIIASSPGIKRASPTTPVLQDYGAIHTALVSLIGRLVALPCHIVVTAHIKSEKDESTGEIKYRPMLSGQLPEKLPILFEEVYRAYVRKEGDKTQRLLQTQSDGRYITRTQIPKLPPVLEMSWETINNVILK